MNVLIVCSGGMSSSIVVKALEKEAEKRGKKLQIDSVSTGEYENKLEEGWDIVLVAPQVRHRLSVFEEGAKKFDIPVKVISGEEYGPLGGDKLMNKLEKIIEGGSDKE